VLSGPPDGLLAKRGKIEEEKMGKIYVPSALLVKRRNINFS
jgi:hypothetical protein